MKKISQPSRIGELMNRAVDRDCGFLLEMCLFDQ